MAGRKGDPDTSREERNLKLLPFFLGKCLEKGLRAHHEPIPKTLFTPITVLSTCDFLPE